MSTSVSAEDLAEDFSMFDIELNDAELVDKLKELCMIFRFDSSSLVDEWVAFSHTHKNVSLSMESVEQFEREKLSRKSQKHKTPNVKREKQRVYDISSMEVLIDGSDAEDLLNAYSTPATKGKNKRLHTTPESVTNKRVTGITGSPSIPYSPGSLPSPVGTPSQKYTSRSNRGEVVCKFGEMTVNTWQGCGPDNCTVEVYDRDNAVTTNFKYMFQKYTDKAHVLNDIIEDLGYELQNANVIENLSHVALPLQETITVAGRVCCDGNGRMNSQSVMLEGSVESSAGKRVSLLLSSLKEYSLFPGQIITVEGINSTGAKLVANKLYEGVLLPFSDPETRDAGKPLHILTTAGPYFTTDSLSLDPLMDFIQVLLKEKPDVCIFFGPFLDSRHEQIVNGMDGMDLTYEEFFLRIIHTIVESTTLLKTQLVFVPSQRDVHHEYVYPQPPYQVKDLPKQQLDRVHFVSDPCTLNINGIIVGLTASDILFHLGAEEISWPVAGSDRLARLCKHTLTQHNYYPLYPPAEEMNVDYEYFEQFAKMQITPDVFILPSDLRFFIKDVVGCVCINPGRLTKGQAGGTYSKLLIQPRTTSKTGESARVAQQTKAQIIKL
ncbi:DNA polymerase alpha subunit B-like [Glandiceps talaboti]